MIPIFIMPIAVLDAVHILSEFTEFYPRLRNRQLTLEHVVRELFKPMFFTSLTTVIGFASLALVPIPPVQVFGIFVAFGVGLAWLLSIALIPAYVMRMSESSLESLLRVNAARTQKRRSLLTAFLRRVYTLATGHARLVIGVMLAVVTASAWGVVRLQVNDNPVRWFAEGHPIRNADQELNAHFAGTYMAYLALEAAPDETTVRRWHEKVKAAVTDWAADNPEIERAAADLNIELESLLAESNITPEQHARRLEEYIIGKLDAAAGDVFIFWEDALALIDSLRAEKQLFKDPAVLDYLAQVQAALEESDVVGKSLSVVDIVKTINRDLRSGEEADYVLPQSRAAIAQTLLTYQGGHRPQDLWHFVTPDYATASIWLLLNSGDNQDMARVVRRLEDFVANHPPPTEMNMNWFGLTYVNVIWQEKMVRGMTLAIIGGYLTVLVVMMALLRSILWGMLAMVPLSATILAIYGVLGLMGKDYDMPVAVLSALTIGLAVDFTIHFLVRVRHLEEQMGSWSRALSGMFEEPARAIVRNILVVAIGFLPLLAAPLVPYNTVGTLIAAILFVAGIATLVVVPAVLHGASGRFFTSADKA
jgi:predicted RND superfamily exporter protein